jgi:hypothetical protein
MERISFVEHRGKRILLIDYSHCSAAEIADVADHAPAIITREPAGSVLLLDDFTGAEFTREAIEHFKIAAARDKPHILRDAMVLDHNLPKALYDSVRAFSTRDFPIFSTREEALEYLTSEKSS